MICGVRLETDSGAAARAARLAARVISAGLYTSKLHGRTSMDSSIAPTRGTGILVTGDLIFSTKIVGTARSLGISIQVAGSPVAALDQLRTSVPYGIFLDLSLSSITPDAMRSIVQSAHGASVLAYGSHVDTERLQQARDAGCTEVMPRSKLSGELPSLLERYFVAKPAT